MLTLMLMTLLWNLFRAFLGLVFVTPVWVVSSCAYGLARVWLYVAVLGLALVAPQPAEAGWFSWLWGSSDTRHIERAAELSQEAARVAAQAAEAQSHQAAAQAEQNSRVAEALAQLSQERQGLADDIQALSTLSLQDSKIAAVLNASGPVLVCAVVLLVAALALWLVARQSASDPRELATAMDVLMEEMATAHVTEAPGLYGHGVSTMAVGRHSSRALIGNIAAHGGGPDASDQPDEAPMPF